MLLPIAYPVRTPRLYFKDANGKPLIGGKVFSYKAGSETEFEPTYRDAYREALNKYPIILDSAGSAFIYMFKAHRLEVFDKNKNWIERRYLPRTEHYVYFYDKYGYPLKNGKVWTYDIQSTIKKPSYQDADLTLPNLNPIILDENGGAAICIQGSYRLRVFDSKNVFITDQDFKQENRFVLTSKTYPLYFIEGVTTDFAMLDAVSKTVMNSSELNENVETSFSILSARIRDVMNGFGIEPESVNTTFALIGATVETYNPYRSTTTSPESVNTAFALVSASQRNAQIINTMQPENVATSFALVGAQITN